MAKTIKKIAVQIFSVLSFEYIKKWSTYEVKT